MKMVIISSSSISSKLFKAMRQPSLLRSLFGKNKIGVKSKLKKLAIKYFYHDSFRSHYGIVRQGIK